MFFKTQHKNYGLTALRAKGRMKKGELNRTESSYAQYLEGEKQGGRVADYWFESLKLKVADGTCWYTPDFMVLLPDGRLELHEVKGSFSLPTQRCFDDFTVMGWNVKLFSAYAEVFPVRAL